MISLRQQSHPDRPGWLQRQTCKGGQPIPQSTTLERFLDKVSPEPNSGCWLWDAADNGKGYGLFSDENGRIYAHRYAYREFVGPIGSQNVLHDCDCPCCVNPDHLHLGSQKDNGREAVERGRNFNTAKTICKRGHPLTRENTYRRLSSSRPPSRECRICKLMLNRRWKERSKE